MPRPATAVLTLALLLAQAGALAAPGSTWRGGWIEHPPHQFTRDGQAAGPDAEILREALRRAGLALKWDRTDRDQLLRDLARGVRQVAAGVGPAAGAATFLHLSRPYRVQEDVFVVRRGTLASWPGKDLREVLRAGGPGGRRVGVLHPEMIHDATLEKFAGSTERSGQAATFSRADEAVAALLGGRIDGLAGDRMVIHAAAARLGARGRLAEHAAFRSTTPVHLAMSRMAVPPEDLGPVDQALASMEADGFLPARRREANRAVLQAMTLDQPWLPALALLSAAAFVLAGVAAERGAGRPGDRRTPTAWLLAAGAGGAGAAAGAAVAGVAGPWWLTPPAAALAAVWCGVRLAAPAASDGSAASRINPAQAGATAAAAAVLGGFLVTTAPGVTGTQSLAATGLTAAVLGLLWVAAATGRVRNSASRPWQERLQRLRAPRPHAAPRERCAKAGAPRIPG